MNTKENVVCYGNEYYDDWQKYRIEHPLFKVGQKLICIDDAKPENAANNQYLPCLVPGRTYVAEEFNKNGGVKVDGFSYYWAARRFQIFTPLPLDNAANVYDALIKVATYCIKDLPETEFN